jgi:hypothetical protein
MDVGREGEKLKTEKLKAEKRGRRDNAPTR